MLAKRFRLQLQHVPRGGKRFPVSVGSIHVLPPQRPYSRFGVVVSARVSKQATKRNRLRRLAFHVCATLKEQRAHDAVIVLSDQALKVTPEVFKKELRVALDAALTK